ncbi:MAG: 3-deoxy-manno-octulosonate cytidylyltransferase [Gammaproteobacteria bacterium]|nr:3-deoxy-manno-octulosonate cytidylyltransferase [Gammaproteobacteria bacterium]
MSFDVVIPARYASTRLPGKPLRTIAGRPMLEHVYRRALESGANRVIIATDDERIAQAARVFDAEVCMTSMHHRSGTERIAEVAASLNLDDDEVVVNVQGDEPLIPPAIIRQSARNLANHTQASVATLCEMITEADDLFDPNVCKVVVDSQGYALYFSRAPIPWHRQAFAQGGQQLPADTQHFRHIGLYAYRAGFLKHYAGWSESVLERTEALEQLRILWQGHRIHVDLAQETPGPGVDSEQDIARVERLLVSAGK